jgi:hypothetical protein
MVGANLAAQPSGGRGRGAAVGWDFADGERFATMLDGGGRFNDGHAHRLARMQAGRQGGWWRRVKRSIAERRNRPKWWLRKGEMLLPALLRVAASQNNGVRTMLECDSI